MIRIGSVPYLNALPLTVRLAIPFETHPPAVLAQKMLARELEIAMLPTAALFASPYRVVPGIAIGCDGPVASVKLLLRTNVTAARRVGLDANSRTSNELAGIVLRERYGIHPNFVTGSSLARFHEDTSLDAQVLIGDDALFNDEPHIDLGNEWKLLTGLPFVFAVWAMQDDVSDAYADILRTAKVAGMKEIGAIAEIRGESRKDLLMQYFTVHMRYDLDERAIDGIKTFARYSGKDFTMDRIGHQNDDCSS
ncbi:MAG: menaquinone biosynthesis protein [Spirochaetota bacterium]